MPHTTRCMPGVHRKKFHARASVCASVCESGIVCMRACVHACVRACMRVCARAGWGVVTFSQSEDLKPTALTAGGASFLANPGPNRVLTPAKSARNGLSRRTGPHASVAECHSACVACPRWGCGRIWGWSSESVGWGQTRRPSPKEMWERLAGPAEGHGMVRGALSRCSDRSSS